MTIKDFDVYDDVYIATFNFKTHNCECKRMTVSNIGRKYLYIDPKMLFYVGERFMEPKEKSKNYLVSESFYINNNIKHILCKNKDDAEAYIEKWKSMCKVNGDNTDEVLNKYINELNQKETEKKMFYVYQDGYYGTELIGSAETREKAEEIKAKRDADWKPGFLWRTRISEKKEKEFSCFD